MFSRRLVWGVAASATFLIAVAPAAHAQSAISIPPDAVSLEGRPEVRVDTDSDGTSRRVLDAREADTSAVKIRIEEGRLFWGDTRRPVTVTAAGDYTYLSSAAEPGRYVRVQRIDDRFAYIEHVDKGPHSVTFWGELRIVLGR